MNNKGSIMFYALMIGITIFVLALALAPAIKSFNDTAMNITGLNCSGTTDKFVKTTCIVTDLSSFYFIGALILISGLIVTARFIFRGGNE